MVKNIIYLFIISLLYSCNSSSNESETKKSKVETDYEMADIFLEYEAEKIGLISIIKNVPAEKTNSVLRDYLAKTMSSSLLTMESPDYIVKVIDTISKKNNLSKKLTASIIFSYQYEIIDDNIEDRQYSQYESEPY